MSSFNKNKGSALLWVLIFSFVLIAIVSAFSYNFRVGAKTIDAVVEHKKSISVHEGYFSKVLGANDLSNDSDETIGDYRFLTHVNSISPAFHHEFVNAKLYEAEPQLITYGLTHTFFENTRTKYIRDFIFNMLANITMSQYDDNIMPLNLPYINTDGMSSAMTTYKLGANDNKVAIYGGYIGYIDKPVFSPQGTSGDGGSGESGHSHKIDICHKPGSLDKTLNVAESSWAAHQAHGDYRGACVDNSNETLTISVYGNNLQIGFPTILSLENYKLSTGWDLKDGEWVFYLAIYDLDKLYVSHTTLTNLRTNASQAQLELSDWKLVSGLPGASYVASETTEYPPYVDGNTYETGDIVSVSGNLYSCKVPGWCTIGSSYSPGSGQYWNLAWDLSGVDESYDGSSGSGTGGGESSYEAYVEGTKYKKNDIVTSQGNLYSCQTPGWCKGAAWAYAPGIGSAWQGAWNFEGADDSTDAGSDAGSTEDEVSSEPISNVVSATWYHNVDNEAPKPLILVKTLRNGSYDIDVYTATYNSTQDTFEAALADGFTASTSDFDESSVKVGVIDELFMLSSGAPLIFQGTNIVDFNLNGSGQLGTGSNSTKATLASPIVSDPVLVKRNATQYYIIYFNGDTVYRYLYSKGVSAPSLSTTRAFPGELIQNVIPKFGALFIVTNSNIYVEYLSSSQIVSSVAVTGEKYQIHRDGSGQIYAMPDGLTCTIDGTCNQSSRIYLDTGCASYTGGCTAMAELNGIDDYMGVVYKGYEK